MLLRAEKGYILIGRDTDGTTEPQDLGMLGPLQSKTLEYVGRRSLFRSDSKREDRRQFVGLMTADPSEVIPTGAHAIEDLGSGSSGPRSLGYVTSSYMSPTLGRSIALGLIERGRERQAAGETVAIYAMGRSLAAKIVAPDVPRSQGRAAPWLTRSDMRHRSTPCSARHRARSLRAA